MGMWSVAGGIAAAAVAAVPPATSPLPLAAEEGGHQSASVLTEMLPATPEGVYLRG